MNRKEFVDYHGSLCDRIRTITAQKNADYTGAGDDPFFNLRTGETLSIGTTEQGLLFRMTDKFTRIITLTKTAIAQVKDETIEDTLLDFANYCLLLACYLKSKRDGAANGN